MRIVGIDPGVAGAIALLVDGQFELVHDMPIMQRGPTSKKSKVNAAELARLVRGFDAEFAVIELVNAMPPTRGKRKNGAAGDDGEKGAGGMGAASAFNFGTSFGVIEGVVAALGIPYAFAPPVAWKTRAGLRGRDKEASRAKAQQLFPSAPLGLKKHVGRAEALLIAKFGGW